MKNHYCNDPGLETRKCLDALLAQLEISCIRIAWPGSSPDGSK